MRKKKVYEKNARLVVNSTWSEGYLSMIMVGAMNVGRIIVNEGCNYEKGDELGYFNLGSTIVMLIEAKDI
jgi:phosphatidylserine decarboxylase